MTLVMSLVVVPFGVMAALYLREYARAGAVVSAVRISINNLAGVPSIVFGVFGLGFFCYIVGRRPSTSCSSPRSLPNPTFGKGGMLWASLTLALLTLPVVIVATEEALAAVPNSMREGSYACGASKWQTIRRIVLPRAMPGIMTGMILAMARGAGEVAPLMLVGAVKLAPELPLDARLPLRPPERSFMHLGFHIYDLGFQSQNSEAAKPMVFTTTLLLIGVVFLLNVLAVRLRTPAAPPVRIREVLRKERTTGERHDPSNHRRRPRTAGSRARAHRRRRALRRPRRTPRSRGEEIVARRARLLALSYGAKQALFDINLKIPKGKVTALDRPLRAAASRRCCARSTGSTTCSPTVRITGDMLLNGDSIYDPGVDVIELRKRMGMVFQKPNPFPMSIYENVVYPLRIDGENATARVLDEVCERSLRGAALWDEVKDRLQDSALGLSGGQQQRLCIARAIAAEPEVLLMDEPCSALDPIATSKIEDLIAELKGEYSILIVTHNMQQAARTSDYTAFMYLGPPDRVRADLDDLHEAAPARDDGLRHRALRLDARQRETTAMTTACCTRRSRRLKKELLALGAIVEELLRKSVRALQKRDTTLAREVMDADERRGQPRGGTRGGRPQDHRAAPAGRDRPALHRLGAEDQLRPRADRRPRRQHRRARHYLAGRRDAPSSRSTSPRWPRRPRRCSRRASTPS